MHAVRMTLRQTMMIVVFGRVCALTTTAQRQQPLPSRVELPVEPEKLSILERVSRSVTFYSRVIPILARYRLADLELERRCASEEECAAEFAELDEWGASKLRDAILELQGFYVDLSVLDYYCV